MKTLKVLTIVAITGLLGATAANACPSNKVNESSCPKQEKCEKQEKYEKCNVQNKGMMNKYDRRSDMREIFQKLDLSAEQKSAMQADRKNMREFRKTQRANMMSTHGMAGMKKFISAEGFNKQGYIDMLTQKSQKRITMRATMFEKKMSILTAEQRAKLMTLLEEK